MRIGIVGAGAVGMSCAIYLQRDGHRVSVFDRLGPGQGASFGNSGIIADCEVVPFGRLAIWKAVPRMLCDPTSPLAVRWRHLPSLVPWFARLALASRPRTMTQISRRLSALLSGAADAWKDIARGTRAADLIENRGWLKVFTSPASREAGLALAEMQRAHGVVSDILSPGQTLELEPALSTSVLGAVFHPDVHSLRSPARAIQILAEDFLRQGGEIRVMQIEALGEGNGRTWLASVSDRFDFDAIIIAAGAWSRPFAAMAGLQAPLESERGYHVMFPHVSLGPTRPVSILSPGYTMAPMIEGIRIASGIEFASLDAPADFRRIERLARHARQMLKDLAPEPTSRWLGCRPSMPNSLPVICAAPRSPRIVLAFGHGHLGVTLGPRTGQMVARMIAHAQDAGAI